jgi:hypothetical protein
MTGPTNSPSTLERLPLALALRVNAACERFENEWRAGRKPRIEEELENYPEGETRL